MYWTAALLLGIGLGGLLDVIVFQDVLQWHFMLSSIDPATTVGGLRASIRWGGILEVFCWVLALAGAFVVYRAARHRMPVPAPRQFAGFALMGWGLFNLAEGLIDHEALGLHHLREGAGYLVWDVAFLAVGGFAFVAVGALLTRQSGDWLVRGRRRGARITPR